MEDFVITEVFQWKTLWNRNLEFRTQVLLHGLQTSVLPRFCIASPNGRSECALLGVDTLALSLVFILLSFSKQFFQNRDGNSSHSSVSSEGISSWAPLKYQNPRMLKFLVKMVWCSGPSISYVYVGYTSPDTWTMVLTDMGLLKASVQLGRIINTTIHIPSQC